MPGLCRSRYNAAGTVAAKTANGYTATDAILDVQQLIQE